MRKFHVGIVLLLLSAGLLGCSTVLPKEPYAFEKATDLLPGKAPFKRKIGIAPIRFRNSKIYLSQRNPEFYQAVESEEAAIIKYSYNDKVNLRDKIIVPMFNAIFEKSMAVSDTIEIFENKAASDTAPVNTQDTAKNGEGNSEGNVKNVSGFGNEFSEAQVLKSLLHECWKNGLDLLAVVTVFRHDIHYKGRNGLVFLNLFMWAYFFFPAWFIADEEYTYTFRAEIQLFPATREEPGQPVFATTVEYTKDLTLSQWAHGLNIARGIINPWWPNLGDRQVSTIRGLVSSDLQKMLSEKLAKDFGERYTRKENETAFKEEMKKRLAFVLGADQLEGRNFRTDIQTDAYYLQDRVGNFKPVVTLTGREATKANIIEKLEREILDRAGPEDKVLLYFSGIGASRKVGDKIRTYLLPYDFKAPAESESEPTTAPEGKESDPVKKEEKTLPLKWGNALSVDRDLAALLSKEQVRTRRTLIMVDTAFNGSSMPLRTFTNTEEVIPLDASPGAILSRSFAKREDSIIFVITACDDAAENRQSASRIEIGEKASMGLFTYFLRKGLRPGPKKGFAAADLNEDRQITVLEIYSFIRNGVEQISQLEGKLQTPTLWFNGSRYKDEPRVKAALGIIGVHEAKPVSALSSAEFGILLKRGLDFPVFTYEYNDKVTDVDKKIILR